MGGESGHAAEEEGEHVQVGEAGKINIEGGGTKGELPEAAKWAGQSAPRLRPPPPLRE